MRLLAVFAVFFLLVPAGFALPIESYSIKFNVVKEGAVVMAELEFPQATTDILKVPLPQDVKGIDIYVDSERQEPAIEADKLVVRLDGAKKVRLSFATKRFIEGTNFVYSFIAPGEIAKLSIRLTLPEGAILKDAVLNSVFPEPDELISDGRSLILLWGRQSLKEGDEIAIFTRYQIKRDYGFLLLPSALAIIIALALLYYVLMLKKAPKAAKRYRYAERKAKKPAKEYDVLKHFKEEEQQIIRVLRQRDGSCEQGTLRVITGFSKATLSRLLSELEERKIIHKEKRGKKNLVFLKEF